MMGRMVTSDLVLCPTCGKAMTRKRALQIGRGGYCTARCARDAARASRERARRVRPRFPIEPTESYREWVARQFAPAAHKTRPEPVEHYRLPEEVYAQALANMASEGRGSYASRGASFDLDELRRYEYTSCLGLSWQSVEAGQRDAACSCGECRSVRVS